MDCIDYTLFTFLLAVCFVTVFSESRHDLNGPCQIVKDCKAVGYFCAKNATCQCRTGYIPSEDWNKCLGFVGSKCIYDYHCIEGAYCAYIDGRDQCRCREADSYVLNEDGLTCASSTTKIFNKETHYVVLLTTVFITFYLNT